MRARFLNIFFAIVLSAEADARLITAAPESLLADAFARLAPGDTLSLAQGTYFAGDLVLNAKGTPAAPITIRSAPGGRAWIARGAVVESESEAWAPVDDALGIFRLIAPAPTGAHAAFLLDAGTQLFPYMDRTQFESKARGVGGYLGPGVFFSGDTVLVRLQHDPADLLDADGNQLLDMPISFDPNRHRIFLAAGEEPTLSLRGAAHLELRDIDLAPGGRRTIAIAGGAHHITFDGCGILARTIGIAVDSSATHVAVLRCKLRMDFPPWAFWSDVKGGASGSTFAPAADAGWNGFAIAGVLRESTIADNSFDRIFDGVFLQAGSSRVLVTGNAFTRGRDDAIDLSPFVDHVEIAQNVIWRCFEGVSLVGGSPRPGLRPGDVFLHHNVIDVSAPQRAEREGDFAVFHATWSSGVPFARHDCGSECDRARWHVYQNTIVARDARSLLPPGLPESVLARNVFYDFGDALVRTDALCLDNVIWLAREAEDGPEADDPTLALGLGTLVVDPRLNLEEIGRPDRPDKIDELRARYRIGPDIQVEITQLLPPDWPGARKDDVPGAVE